MKFGDRIYRWLDTQLSIARFGGGITIEGVLYRVDTTDPEMPLLRAGVPTRAEEYRARKQAERKEQAERAQAAQGELL